MVIATTTHISLNPARHYHQQRKISRISATTRAMSDFLGGSRSDEYEIVYKMGSGKHADIFKAFRVLDLKSCIIRPAKQVGRPGIEQEIKILLSLKGGPNILELEDIVRDDQVSRTPKAAT